MTFTRVYVSVRVCLSTCTERFKTTYFVRLLTYSLQVTNVWNLDLKDRWSLYRRWSLDVRQCYRRAISLLHREFEWGVERLQKARAMQDLKVLEHADVIGMTTTGERGPMSA